MRYLPSDNHNWIAYISELKAFVGPFTSKEVANNWAYANLDGEAAQLLRLYNVDQFTARFAK